MSSGSIEFDRLKQELENNTGLKKEVEFAFSALLRAANPSDRGMRFLFGQGAEWIIASAAWEAGVLTAPSGHNQNGFDLGYLLNSAQGIWSIKASASKHNGTVRLKNFMGEGVGAEWEEPTLFVSPYLGGAVLVHPKIHTQVTQKARHSGDALTIGCGAVKKFAKENPENFAPFEVIENIGQNRADPYAFIRSILKPDIFPILSRPFQEAQAKTSTTVVDSIQELVRLEKDGVLTKDQLSQAISKTLES